MTFTKGTIAAVGDEDTMLAFKSVGVKTFSVTTTTQADDALKSLSKENCSIIFLSENFAANLNSTLDILKKRTIPAVVAIPSATGENKGFGAEYARKIIEKAVGSSFV